MSLPKQQTWGSYAVYGLDGKLNAAGTVGADLKLGKPELPVLLPSNTLHLRAFDDAKAASTKCGLPTKGAWEGEPDAVHFTERMCKRCFK